MLRKGREGRSKRAIWADWKKADKAGDADAARLLAVEMTEAAPDSFHAWFEAGLYSKARGDWADSLERNRRAASLYGRLEKIEYGVNPAAWNMGIAATAIGDWTTARDAWIAYGIEGIEPGSAPIDVPFGMTPIRVNPDSPSLPHQAPVALGETEVVWCWRRSPAHAVVASVPFPESGHRFGDVLLHDGEPKGERQINGGSVPVFDELARLEESGLSTWQAVVHGAEPADLAALEDVFGPRGLGVDDWSGVRLMCTQCSHGTPKEHAHRHDPPADGARTLGLAGAERDIRAALDGWTAERPHLTVTDLVLIW